MPRGGCGYVLGPVGVRRFRAGGSLSGGGGIPWVLRRVQGSAVQTGRTGSRLRILSDRLSRRFTFHLCPDRFGCNTTFATFPPWVVKVVAVDLSLERFGVSGGEGNFLCGALPVTFHRGIPSNIVKGFLASCTTLGFPVSLNCAGKTSNGAGEYHLWDSYLNHDHLPQDRQFSVLPSPRVFLHIH